jgi:transcriptional regulator with XRE-family HTH domain
MKSDDTKKVTGAQLRAARALLRWSADDLAGKSGVGLATIRRAELIDGETKMTTPNVAAVRTALESAGVEFIGENGGGAGVRLKQKHGKTINELCCGHNIYPQSARSSGI